MFRKFAVRLFSIIFLPLVACQLPGGQSAQPTELPTPIPTAPPTAEPTPVPTATPATEPLPATGIPLCEPLLANDKQARYTSGQIIGDYVGYGQQWPNDNAEIVILDQNEEISKVQPYVSAQTFELLTNTDFTTHFVVLAFEGKRKNLLAPNPDFTFCISQWSRNERDAALSLQLLEQYIVPSVIFYTYFCFQVARDETWQGDFTFKLHETRYIYTNSTVYHDGVVAETKFTFP